MEDLGSFDDRLVTVKDGLDADGIAHGPALGLLDQGTADITEIDLLREGHFAEVNPLQEGLVYKGSSSDGGIYASDYSDVGEDLLVNPAVGALHLNPEPANIHDSALLLADRTAVGVLESQFSDTATLASAGTTISTEIFGDTVGVGQDNSFAFLDLDGTGTWESLSGPHADMSVIREGVNYPLACSAEMRSVFSESHVAADGLFDQLYTNRYIDPSLAESNLIPPDDGKFITATIGQHICEYSGRGEVLECGHSLNNISSQVGDFILEGASGSFLPRTLTDIEHPKTERLIEAMNSHLHTFRMGMHREVESELEHLRQEISDYKLQNAIQNLILSVINCVPVVSKPVIVTYHLCSLVALLGGDLRMGTRE